MKSFFLVLLVSLVLGAAFLFTRSGPDTDSGALRPDKVGGAEAAASAKLGSPELDAVKDDGTPARDEAPALSSPKMAAVESPAVEGDETPAMATLRGRITDANGVGLPGGEVHLSQSSMMLMMGSAPDAADTESKEDGAFEVSLRPGTHTAFFGVDGYAPMTQSVTAGPGEAVDLGDVRLPQGVRISGRVTNDRGLPVEGAAVHRPVESSGGMIQIGVLGLVASTTDAGGYFEILRQAAGPYEFTVDHPDHLRATFEGAVKQPGGAAHGIEVTLEQGVSIVGTVTGVPADVDAGSLYAFARLDSRQDGEMMFRLESGAESGLERSASVSEDGSFRIRGLKADAGYNVWISSSKSTWRSGARRSERVAARSGDQGVQLPYGEGATLRLAIHGPDGSPVPSATISGGFGYENAFEDTVDDAAAGTHALRHLWPLPGNTTFDLSIDARGFESFQRKEIEIAPRGEVNLGVITLQLKPKLEVTILDGATGKPVEGARVSLEEVQASTGSGSMTFSRSVNASLDDTEDLEDLDFSMLGKEVKRTDENGKCALDVEIGSSFHVDVIHPDFAEMRTDPVRIGAAVTESTVKLLPGGRLSVLVQDADGNPLPGAEVERRGEDDRPSPAKATTGKDGRVILKGLEPGVHGLRLGEKRARGMVMIANMPGMDAGPPWTEFTVEAGQTAEAMLQAEPPMHVTGTITESGAPLAGAKISLREAAARSGMPSFLGGGSSATTDARGRFRMEDVKGGDSTLVVSHPTRAMDYEHSFEIEAGDNEVDLDLGVTIVEGVVTDHAGEPLAGAKVKAGRAGSTGSRMMVSFVMSTDGADGAGETFVSGGAGEPEAVFTDADGRYSLRGVQAGTEIAVSATADGYDTAKSEPFTVDAGEVRTGVDLAFELTGAIKIQIDGGTGRTIAIMRRRGDSVRDPRIVTVSGEGTTVEDLAPGAWTVRLDSMGGGDVRFAPKELEVDVVAGETSAANFEQLDR